LVLISTFLHSAHFPLYTRFHFHGIILLSFLLIIINFISFLTFFSPPHRLSAVFLSRSSTPSFLRRFHPCLHTLWLNAIWICSSLSFLPKYPNFISLSPAILLLHLHTHPPLQQHLPFFLRSGPQLNLKILRFCLTVLISSLTLIRFLPSWLLKELYLFYRQ